MKTILLIIILFFLTQSCRVKEQGLSVRYENFEINIPGSPGPWVKHEDKFYCFFETDNDEFSTGSTQHFYILDKNGKTESKIDVPEKMQKVYYDLYVKNDTIFTTEYYDHNTFFLANNKWVETKKAIDLYYEDDDYNVYSLDFGEWGGVTWFNDKTTNQQYELAASSPVINRLGNIYFVTLADKIIEITNPKKMELSEIPYDYAKAVLSENFPRRGSDATKGTEIIYEFENEDYFYPKFLFGTSFITNNKLYHIYKDSVSTKIGTIDNKKLINTFSFKANIIPFRRNYDWRNQIQNNRYQTIQFATKNDNEYGIIEINDNAISVSSFKNLYKEIELGEEKMKEWFESNFDYYFSNFDKLFLKDIDSIEKKESATNITQTHKISHYLLDGKNIETPRIYRRLENSNLKLITQYYYSANSKSIELIEFGWSKNKPRFMSFDDMNSVGKNDFKAVYQSKFNWISNFLSNKLGKPITQTRSDKNASEKWRIGNKLVELAFNENSVSVKIYKK